MLARFFMARVTLTAGLGSGNDSSPGLRLSTHNAEGFCSTDYAHASSLAVFSIRGEATTTAMQELMGMYFRAFIQDTAPVNHNSAWFNGGALDGSLVERTRPVVFDALSVLSKGLPQNCTGEIHT